MPDQETLPSATTEIAPTESARVAALDFPGVSLSKAFGLVLPEGLPYENAAAIAEALPAMGDVCKWAIGKLLNYSESAYSEKYGQIMSLTGLSYDTLRSYAYVERTFPVERRRQMDLRWWVFREIASLTEDAQETWLDFAETNKPTVEEFRAQIKGVKAVRFPATVTVPANVSASDVKQVMDDMSEMSDETQAEVVKAVRVVAKNGAAGTAPAAPPEPQPDPLIEWGPIRHPGKFRNVSYEIQVLQPYDDGDDRCLYQLWVDEKMAGQFSSIDAAQKRAETDALARKEGHRSGVGA